MIGKLRLGIGNWELQHDSDYGIDKRTGWSIVSNGSFLVQLEPSLFMALRKSWRMWRLRRAGS